MQDLIDKLEAAEIGTPTLSREVFLALGGEMRSEPASNQGGAWITRPYWPGTKHPCMSIAFATSALDVLHYVARHASTHGYHFAEGFAYTAEVDGHQGAGRTLPLAMCAALLRWRREIEAFENEGSATG